MVDYRRRMGRWSALLGFALAACHDDDARPAIDRQATASLVASQPPTPDGHSEHDCASHAAPKPHPGASATSLQSHDALRADKIRVSAHQGGALLRKQGGAWNLVGKRGCRVADETVSRALANLSQLTVGKQLPSWPAAAPFELQLDVTSGDETLLHLELSPRRDDVDMVQLLGGDVFELRGLDRNLWSSEAATWCGSANMARSN